MVQKFLASGRHKGYRTPGLQQRAGISKVSTLEEYELPVTGSTNEDKKVEKLYELNELTFKNLILSVDHESATSKTALQLLKNCKTAEYLEGNVILHGMDL